MATSRAPLPRALLPPLRDLARCVRQGWCALLVGGAGSGKSSLVRTLAALVGAPLVEHAMTPATDTSELLGGFEQLDAARADLELANGLDRVVRGLVAAASALATRTGLSNVLELHWALRCRLQQMRRARLRRRRLGKGGDNRNDGDDEEEGKEDGVDDKDGWLSGLGGGGGANSAAPPSFASLFSSVAPEPSGAASSGGATDGEGLLVTVASDDTARTLVLQLTTMAADVVAPEPSGAGGRGGSCGGAGLRHRSH